MPDPAPTPPQPASAAVLVGDALLTGLGGAAVIALAEVVALLPFDAELTAVTLALHGAVGAAIALVLGVEEAAIRALRRPTTGPIAALVRSLGALIVLVPVAAHLFEGAFAATLPGARVMPFVIPAVGVAGLALVAWIGARLCARDPRWRRRLAAALALLVVAVEWINRRTFRSEYPDVHTMLVIVACVAAGLALRLALPRLVRPRPAGLLAELVLGCAAIAGFAASLEHGLRTPESRLRVATDGMHTRMLVRLARGLVDRDGDGYAAVLGGADCDDTDPEIHPEAREIVGNEVDEDCDGYVAREDVAAAMIAEEERREAEVETWLEGQAIRELRARLDGAPILFLTVDALRGDVLADTPTNRADYPAIFRLLDASTTFPRAFAPAAGTDLSLSSLLTGRVDPFRSVDVTLFEALAERGYAGYAVIPSEVLRYVGKALITRGLRDFERLINDGEKRDVGSYTTSQRTTKLGLQLLDRHLAGDERERPPLLWLHYFDVHEHDEVEADDRNLLDYLGDRPLEAGKAPRYRAMVGLVDREIGRVIAALEERGLWDRTIVVFASDHGESLGEDPRLPDHHGRVLYNPLVHVPLAIRIPGAPPSRPEAPVSLLDVAPTLLSLFVAPPPDGLDGATLLPQILPGAPAELRDAIRPIVLNESDQRGVILWPWKAMIRDADNITELYDLAHDFGERDNLAADEPAKVGELLQIYQAAPAVNLDRTTKGRRLREKAARSPAKVAPG
ncbi:MAG: sulfatase-like hydrolase/transferase [Nannocystaceae bacterium]